MNRSLILLFVLLLTSCGLDPVQHKVLHDIGLSGDSEYQTITGEEMWAKLSKRYGPDRVSVTRGTYKVPKLHDMPIGHWCSRHPGLSYAALPGGWDCQDYSSWAAVEMQRQGFAGGVVWSEGHPHVEGHMINIFFIEDERGDIKIAFYEPQDCYWVDEPRIIDHVVIQ